MDSIMKMYVVDFQYVVKYYAYAKKRPMSSVPMAAYLTAWSWHVSHWWKQVPLRGGPSPKSHLRSVGLPGGLPL